MGVDIMVGGGTEEECLGKFPALPGLFPSLAGCLDIAGGKCACGMFLLDGIAQVAHADGCVGHCRVCGPYGVFYISLRCGFQSLLLLRQAAGSGLVVVRTA